MKIQYPLKSVKTRVPFVAFVEEALPAELCRALVARIEAESPSVAPIMVRGRPVMNTSIRNNERVIFDDAPLAAELFERTHEAIPQSLHGALAVGYNERFRGYRYRDGQRFAPHFDGAYFRPDRDGVREGSQLSALFYVSDGFSGGQTDLIDYQLRIVPTLGSLLLFEHAMLHEGCAVTSGTKYVLRTDAMYRFDEPSGKIDP